MRVRKTQSFGMSSIINSLIHKSFSLHPPHLNGVTSWWIDEKNRINATIELLYGPHPRSGARTNFQNNTQFNFFSFNIENIYGLLIFFIFLFSYPIDNSIQVSTDIHELKMPPLIMVRIGSTLTKRQNIHHGARFRIRETNSKQFVIPPCSG